MVQWEQQNASLGGELTLAQASVVFCSLYQQQESHGSRSRSTSGAQLYHCRFELMMQACMECNIERLTVCVHSQRMGCLSSPVNINLRPKLTMRYIANGLQGLHLSPGLMAADQLQVLGDNYVTLNAVSTLHNTAQVVSHLHARTLEHSKSRAECCSTVSQWYACGTRPEAFKTVHSSVVMAPGDAEFSFVSFYQ